MKHCACSEEAMIFSVQDQDRQGSDSVLVQSLSSVCSAFCHGNALFAEQILKQECLTLNKVIFKPGLKKRCGRINQGSCRIYDPQMLFLVMISLSKGRLRSFQFGDEISLQENANNAAVWMNLRNSFPHPFTVNDAISWISLNRINPQPSHLAITINDDVVGGIGITQQTDIYQLNAEIGYWLGEPFWNKGIMTEAVRAMVDYTFANFQVIRIFAGVFDYNLPSMRVLEKAGFHKEAVHRKAICKNGEIYDEHLYTILKPGADKSP